MPKSRTYKELALEFKNTKSEKIYNELYKKMKPGLRSYINNIVKDSDVADDITSTTLTTIYLKIDQYNPDYQITTWAYRIAYNECIGLMRSRNKNVSMNVFTDAGIEPRLNELELNYDMPIKTDDDFWDEEYILNTQINLINEAINALPPMYKNYMTERFINNKSYDEILKIMSNYERGINLQTVKNRIFRGRKIIKNQLGKMQVFSEYQCV